MQAAINAFEAGITRVRSLHGIHHALSRQLTSAVDLSDLLRAEIVMGVSALDHYIHELARLGMLECWSGHRKSTEAFKRFPLPMSVAAGLSSSSTTELLEAEIRAKHSFLSFQHPDKIADAVRLFSEVKLWDEVATELKSNARTIKSALNLIIDRRNKIAHEADADPSYPGERWPVDTALVEETLDTLDQIAHAIFRVVTRSQTPV
ncbi:HEPN domain-containing protein [Azospirillum argentinense]|uniref:HEPN domain-containing protein n=1 Tax=Azospirillum argentinense TaxID=2970906 RepID=A0ABW8VHI5_9PROT